MKVKQWLVVVLISIMVMPAVAFGAVNFSVDMDPLTAGIQNTIFGGLTPGAAFSTDIWLTLTDNTDNLSSFGFSVMWDDAGVDTPVSVTSSIFSGGWADLGCAGVDDSVSLVVNCAQANIGLAGFSEGPLSSVVATIDWLVRPDAAPGIYEINAGFFDPFDEAFDKDFSNVTPTFSGGEVPVVPEPISSTLFLIGGATLGFRRFVRRKK